MTARLSVIPPRSVCSATSGGCPESAGRSWPCWRGIGWHISSHFLPAPTITIGGDIARRSIGVLRRGGLLVTIVDRRDVDLAARTEAAGRRFAGLSVEPDYPALEALADLAVSGKLRVHLQATLGLAEAAKAHELLESGSVTGKIVLTV